MKAKEYITLHFAPGVRSVPILAKATLCGVEGFAVHPKYTYSTQQNPEPGIYRVSHIGTGSFIAEGPTIPDAIAAAEAKCKFKGGAKAIAKAIKITSKLIQAKGETC